MEKRGAISSNETLWDRPEWKSKSWFERNGILVVLILIITLLYE